LESFFQGVLEFIRGLALVDIQETVFGQDDKFVGIAIYGLEKIIDGLRDGLVIIEDIENKKEEARLGQLEGKDLAGNYGSGDFPGYDLETGNHLSAAVFVDLEIVFIQTFDDLAVAHDPNRDFDGRDSHFLLELRLRLGRMDANI